MSDVTSAWKDAGERLAALGASLKAHYEEQHGTESEEAKREMGAAAKRFTGAVQDAFDALGAAARDPAVKGDVQKVGQSLAGALSATFAEVSEDLSRLARKERGTTESEPTQGEAPQAEPPQSEAPQARPPQAEAPQAEPPKADT